LPVGHLFLLAPWHFRLWLPLYGHDSIRLTPMAAVLTGLGVEFAVFGAWALSRGVGRGILAILIGCAAPMATESPVALVISIPTLAGAFGVAVLRGRERDRTRTEPAPQRQY
jgi:hypothetical protein